MHFPKLFQNYCDIWGPKVPHNDTCDTDLVDQDIKGNQHAALWLYGSNIFKLN